MQNNTSISILIDKNKDDMLLPRESYKWLDDTYVTNCFSCKNDFSFIINICTNYIYFFSRKKIKSP